MEKKQTAVDLIFEKFNLLSDADFKSWMFNNHDELKQMEKEQIEMACNQQEFEDIDGLGICETISKGEQYYNETYGGTQC